MNSPKKSLIESTKMVTGLSILIITTILFHIIPPRVMHYALQRFIRWFYNIRTRGLDHLPAEGPALLVSNHLSYIDGFIIAASMPRYVQFMVHRDFYNHKFLNHIFKRLQSIPVGGKSRHEIQASIEQARQALQKGHLVCIFPEGQISRTGNLLPFKRGMEKITEGLDVPIIPVYLHGLWDSLFSYKGGRAFWKRPRRLSDPVIVSFGKPLSPTTPVKEVRQSVAEEACGAFEAYFDKTDRLHQHFIRNAKKHPSRLCIADSTGKKLTYRRTLAASMLLAGWIDEYCPEQENIGIMFPASVAGVLFNTAASLAHRVPVNLNFTVGTETVEKIIEKCSIKTIITSRTFLHAANLPVMEGMVYVEDIFKEIPKSAKLVSLLRTYLPVSQLLKRYQPAPNASQLATLLFSSGSTGTPKGIMLTHQNILANIQGFSQLYFTTKKDGIMGVLPFFHAFGYTATLWFPLLYGFRGIYHPKPMDASKIGEMTQTYKATILISTPTFYKTYLKKCTPAQFSTLRMALSGAERLNPQLTAAFKERYDLTLLEGYGSTEMGPVVSLNSPDYKLNGFHQAGYMAGTVGLPIPGVAAKIVDPETGEPLTTGQEGMLLLKGASRMIGYYNDDKETQKAIRDGWYVSGDIASVDQNGFLRITDRLSRFSKIGGEMVPHIRIEEQINQVLQEESCVVTSIPHTEKGECLVVFYTKPDISPREVWNRLSQSGLPNLWIPKKDYFFLIDAIPTLGTGKIDLKQINLMAREVVL